MQTGVEMPTKFKVVPLQTRDTPPQKRAQERISQVLETTAQILASVPTHAVTTAMIASKTDIPVSSIYRYFPKIEDVFDELYFQLSERIEARMMVVFEDAETYPGWRDRHRGIYRTFRDFRAEHPYYLPLMQSFLARSGPESVDLGKSTGIAAYLAERWARGGDGFEGGDPVIVSRITMQTFLAIEGFTASHIPPDQAEAYFDELSLSQERYLAYYLSDDR